MKSHLVLLTLTLLSSTNALINDIDEDCIITNPISNTIITAGEQMKIQWTNSHADKFPTIYLVQSDGVQTPIVIAQDVPTAVGNITVDLPRSLIPSNACKYHLYYMTLGENPKHCKSGNLRIVGASSIIPDPKPPNGLEHQISSGRFPKSVSNAMSLTVLPASLLGTLVFSIVFNLV